MTTQLALNLTADESIAPDAILGPCPVNLSQSNNSGLSQAHYHCICLDGGTSTVWHELLMESRMRQYTDLCEWNLI